MRILKLQNYIVFVTIFSLTIIFSSSSKVSAGEYLNLYNKEKYNAAFRSAYKDAIDASSDEAEYVIGLILLCPLEKIIL